MEMRKTWILLALLLCAPAFAQSSGDSVPQEGTSYALPRTVLRLEVEARQEVFHAGPYARYARKYLGVDARQADETTSQVTGVRLTALTEADPASRYLLPAGKSTPSFLRLSTQGLVSLAGAGSQAVQWRFPATAPQEDAAKGLTSNLTSESATLYRRGASDGQTIAVQQQMVVEKSPDARAKETADIIFDLRKKKLQIVTGDTDATFSGEALGAAIAEIDRLEREYLAMFLGSSTFRNYTMYYDVLPKRDAKNQRYIAFRLSDNEGLVPSDNVSGKPFILELIPEKLSGAAGDSRAAKGSLIWYRIPTVCTVKLSEGASVLLQTRVPVYQLGVDNSLPLSK